MNIVRGVGSVAIVGLFIVGSLGTVVATQTGCSKTCSDSESQACTDKFTTCTNNAASAASKSDCQACAKSYCDCYDACGNDCNPSDHQGTCDQIP